MDLIDFLKEQSISYIASEKCIDVYGTLAFTSDVYNGEEIKFPPLLNVHGDFLVPFEYKYELGIDELYVGGNLIITHVTFTTLPKSVMVTGTIELSHSKTIKELPKKLQAKETCIFHCLVIKHLVSDVFNYRERIYYSAVHNMVYLPKMSMSLEEFEKCVRFFVTDANNRTDCEKIINNFQQARKKYKNES